METPVEIISGTGEHKTEQRIFVRRNYEHYCVDPNCQFNGKHAQQGICYSADGELVDYKKLEAKEKELETELKEIKEIYTDKDEYIQWLEAMYVCSQLNWDSTLDECIHLRAKNSVLVAKLEKAGGENQ